MKIGALEMVFEDRGVGVGFLAIGFSHFIILAIIRLQQLILEMTRDITLISDRDFLTGIGISLTNLITLTAENLILQDTFLLIGKLARAFCSYPFF